MRELAGKTAFVTGAASGTGFALSRSFAEAGMKVVLTDIETDALAAAVEDLHEFGSHVLGFSPYAASKFAVVTMSEGLAKQLAPLGVTVLCLGFVRTRIWDSDRNRPDRYGPARIPDPASTAGKLLTRLAERGQAGLDPAAVAAQVLTAIRENELYVFTHADTDWRAELEERFTAILAAMDKAAARQNPQQAPRPPAA